MKKVLLLCLTITIVLCVSSFSPALALDSVGGVHFDRKDSSLGTIEAITPAGLEYIEGLNDDQSVDDSWSYAADLFGIEYTPTASYDLKRVELMAGEGSGEFVIQLRLDSAGMPSDVVEREARFEMVDPVSWQGAEFPESYPLIEGRTYWIVYRPVVGSQSSVATNGTLITHVWDYGGDGWDGIMTGFYWMVKFYKETAEFEYSVQLNPYVNVIHFNANPGGWLNGVMDDVVPVLHPVLGKAEGGRFYFAIDIIPDQTPGFYELIFIAGRVATRDGEMLRTIDGLTFDGPTYIWLTMATDSEAPREGVSITEVMDLGPEPEAWYAFQVNPYPDIVHLNTNPGGWLNGYDDLYEPDAPVLGK
ncbi:MAG: hypothetical protein JSV76_01210, partial [Candidatus Bathyarchaeota archaeon]